MVVVVVARAELMAGEGGVLTGISSVALDPGSAESLPPLQAARPTTQRLSRTHVCPMAIPSIAMVPQGAGMWKGQRPMGCQTVFISMKSVTE